MNIKLFKLLSIVSTLLSIVIVQGCAGNMVNKSDNTIPVTWDSGFILPDLLASAIEINQISNITQLIATPWYAEIAVSHTKSGQSIFTSCQDYFEQAIAATRTSKENEMGPYLEFKAMCEAARLLISAKDSKWSYLPDLILSDESPRLWPKSVALQTSQEESKRNDKNNALTFWEDITPITKYESQSITKSTYHHKGGYQELDIVGRGDSNNDSIEDVIVVVRDYLEGGNYFNIRLLILSVDIQNKWRVLAEI